MLDSLINLSASILLFLLKFPDIHKLLGRSVQHSQQQKRSPEVNYHNTSDTGFLTVSGLTDLMSFGINPHLNDKIITDGFQMLLYHTTLCRKMQVFFAKNRKNFLFLFKDD